MSHVCKCPKCSSGCTATDEQKFEALSELLSRRNLCPCKPRPKIFKEKGYRFIEFNNASIQECTKDEECDCHICPSPCPNISIKTCLKKKKSSPAVVSICSSVSVRPCTAGQSSYSLQPCKQFVELKSAPCSAIQLAECTTVSCPEKTQTVRHKNTQKDVNINLQLNMPRKPKTGCSCKHPSLKSTGQSKAQHRNKNEKAKTKHCLCGKETAKHHFEASKPIIICNRPPEPRPRSLLEKVKSMIAHEKTRKSPVTEETECACCETTAAHSEQKVLCACSQQVKAHSKLSGHHKGQVITQCKAYMKDQGELLSHSQPVHTAEQSGTCVEKYQQHDSRFRINHQQCACPKEPVVCSYLSKQPESKETACACQTKISKHKSYSFGKHELVICPKAQGDVGHHYKVKSKNKHTTTCACAKHDKSHPHIKKCGNKQTHSGHQSESSRTHGHQEHVDRDRKHHFSASDLKLKRAAKRNKSRQSRNSTSNGGAEEISTANGNGNRSGKRSSFKSGNEKVENVKFHAKIASRGPSVNPESLKVDDDSKSTTHKVKHHNRRNHKKHHKQEPIDRCKDEDHLHDSKCGYSNSSDLNSQNKPKRVHSDHSLSIIYSEQEKERDSQVIKPQNIRYFSIQYSKPAMHRLYQKKSGLHHREYIDSFLSFLRISKHDHQTMSTKCSNGIKSDILYLYIVIRATYIGWMLIYINVYKENIKFVI